jgi:hypothetical protein
MEGGAGNMVAWVNRKILSNPGVVWIGLISYPLYLFHWPALSFVHIVKGSSPKPVYLADALIISLILSVITYYFLEKNVRHNKSRWTISVLATMFLSVGLIGLIVSNGSIPAKYHPVFFEKTNLAICDQNMLAGWTQVLRRNDFVINSYTSTGPQTLFIGDSNMQQYAPRLLSIVSNQSYSVRRGIVLVTKGGVPPIPEIERNGNLESKDVFDAVDQQIAENKNINKVVIASSWCSYFSGTSQWKIRGNSFGSIQGQKMALEQLDAFIKKMKAKGTEVTLVLSIPIGHELDPKSSFIRSFCGIRTSKEVPLSKKQFLDKNGNASLLAQIKSVGLKNGAIVIDPLDYLCTNGICITEDAAGVPIRYDEGHLRPGYVREEVKYLDQTVAP